MKCYYGKKNVTISLNNMIRVLKKGDWGMNNLTRIYNQSTKI